MFFAKNEIVELAGGKKYIIVETTEYKEKYYYYICEVTEDEQDVKDEYKVITTVSENGSLFVKTIKDELEPILTDIFKKKLEIR